MTIDKEKLKQLKERCVRIEVMRRNGWSGNPVFEESDVLALLAEIERLERDARNDTIAYKAAIERQEEIRQERDQLKAENEALRKQVADDERKLDALLAHCDDGECPTCAQIICPHGGAMHFHHDGCPTCAAHEETMAKEASHG